MATEKLIVKNFGPIVNAELDLKKVTVLIGEQASGKSVLAKLVTTFSEKLFHSDVSIIQTLKEYNIHQYLSKKTSIQFNSKDFSVQYKNDKFLVEKEAETIIKGVAKSAQVLSGKTQKSILQKKELNLKTGIYIPAERILISLISESLFGFVTNDISLPKFLLNFGNEYEKARKEIKNFHSKNLDIRYAFENNNDKITYKKVKSSLVDSSSGLQSILPLLLIIEKYSSKKSEEQFLFITEEPELNLYPNTQKELLKYLIENCTKGDNRLIITTHSPYILTALNNLIQAHNVVKKNPEMADEVAKIVSPQYQIDFEDVGVYFIANGTAKSIMNIENQLIDANALDEVNNDISEDFGKLLQLEFQNETL